MTAVSIRIIQNTKRLLAAALVVLLLAAFVPGPAAAANDDGLTVNKLTFRDVLRLYTLDKKSFGTDAMTADAGGVTNAAKRLAEMFAYTVGLNYTGQGANSNYFGKDVTSKMGKEPYADANLLYTYNVEISPYRSYAVALPQGKTTAIRVYLTGYSNAASGIVPVLHYVWQEGSTWLAVKDDSPYYQVSYNGHSAAELKGTGLIITQTRAASGGTDALQDWSSLTDAPDGKGIVHLDGSTLVAGQGTANVFGLTTDMSALESEGDYSPSLLAVSDFVRGDTTYQTGPLVYSRECFELPDMRRVPDGEVLREGVSYRFRVVYDEALAVTPGLPMASAGMSVRSEVTGQTRPVADFVWYGGSDYLITDLYNPHTVEFTFTPSDEGKGVCTFLPENLVGSESGLKAADLHACTQTAVTAAPASAAAPAVNVQTAPAAPAASATPVPTPAPTATPAPAPTTPPATLTLFDMADGALLTRGTLAQTLWILSGQPAAELSGALSDLPADPAAAMAVAWVASTGLIPGYGDGTFHPDFIITREQAAVILSRFAGLRGRDVSVAGDLGAYPDADAVAGGSRGSVTWALERGLLIPRSDGRIAPNDAVLCGEAIAMIAALQQGR